MRTIHSYKPVAIVMLALIVAFAAHGVGFAEDKVWTSGTHGLNEHVIPDIDPNIELVNGRISDVTSSGIYMDGEYFPLIGAEIIDDQFRPAEIKNLYVGLEVQVLKRFGGVSKLLCFNMIRSSGSAPADSGRTGGASTGSKKN